MANMRSEAAPAKRPGRGSTVGTAIARVAQMAAALVLAVLVTVPDREIQAKTFKMGLILENLHRRLIPNA